MEKRIQRNLKSIDTLEKHLEKNTKQKTVVYNPKKLSTLTSEFILKHKIKAIPSKNTALLPTPHIKYGLNTEKNEINNILIKDISMEKTANRNKKVNDIIEEVIDLSIDPPLYWRKGNENDIGTSTEDLHEKVNERDLEKLIDHANMSTKTIEKKTDRQIIATLSQEVAIKNQYIKGLEDKSDQFEKGYAF